MNKQLDIFVCIHGMILPSVVDISDPYCCIINRVGEIPYTGVFHSAKGGQVDLYLYRFDLRALFALIVG
jgi:hypothetical protein